MSWWPDFNAIKRKACGYLLRRYGGSWLKEKEINLHQLSIDLYNGKASFSHFDLDINQINESLSEFGVPLEVIDCFIGEVSANVPWSSIFSDNSILEVKNLELSLSPIHRENSNVSLFDSMLFSSMTTSMQLAEECLREEDAELNCASSLPYEGVHDLACTVEAIFTKVKINFLDTTVCIEYYKDKGSSAGILLEMKIEKIEYFDEDALAPAIHSTNTNTNDNCMSDKQKLFETASIKIKNFHFYGIKIYMSELKNIQSKSCTQSDNGSNIGSPNLKSSDVITQQPSVCKNLNDFSSINKDLNSYCDHDPEKQKSNNKLINSDENVLNDQSDKLKLNEEESILFLSFGGRQELKLKLKQNMELPGPKKEFDCQFAYINCFFTPKLLNMLIKIGKAILDPPDRLKKYKQMSKKMVADDYEKIKLGLQHAHQSRNSVQAFQPQTFEESDEENDIYLSMAAGKENQHFRSMNSSYSSDVTNQESNMSDSSSTTFTKKKKVPTATLR